LVNVGAINTIPSTPCVSSDIHPVITLLWGPRKAGDLEKDHHYGNVVSPKRKFSLSPSLNDSVEIGLPQGGRGREVVVGVTVVVVAIPINQGLSLCKKRTSGSNFVVVSH